MKNKLSVLLCILLSFFLLSCNNNDFKRTENGALMKFHTINKNNEMPEVGDLVVLDVTQKISDTIMFSSEMLDEPFEILVEEPSFDGDIMDALMCMHVGDRASLIFPVDSMFVSIGEIMPTYIEPGTLVEMDISLKEIVRKEVLEEQLRQEMLMRKQEEISFLSQYYDDNQYSITADSLIVVNLNQGKGRFAKAGDIMKVYFTFQTMEGDTLLNFITDSPYELVFGDMALGQGFYEGLGLVAKGGEAEFIIPSSLAWGQEGFQGVILPYTSFKFNLKVVDIMTSDEYEAEQKILMEKEAAERAKKLKEEPKKIAKYVKDNNIKEEPKESGLYFIETTAGYGDSVQKGDMVSVHYVIYNIDNTLIESSYEYGQPIVFVYGDNQMIPGIEEAVGYMRVGGKSRIIVPSQLGFGDIEIDENLPANSALVIDLELVDLYR